MYNIKFINTGIHNTYRALFQLTFGLLLLNKPPLKAFKKQRVTAFILTNKPFTSHHF